MTVNRRQFLGSGIAAAAGLAIGARLGPVAGEAAGAAAIDGDATLAAVPFYGAHQSGITSPPPAAAAFASFDVTAASVSELRSLMQTLTQRSAFLTQGGTPPDLGVGSPPSDSGVLGPTIPADALTVTVGVGSSLFDSRFGLTSAKPPGLVPMRTFPNDRLDPSRCHGDLLLQICGGSPDTVHHALRDLTKHTRAGMQLRWRIDGFNSPPRPTGAGRNLLGFADGIQNPTVNQPDVAAELLWLQAGSGTPAWAVGGAYQVTRIIRNFIEFWDRVSLEEQELMFGRHRDTGVVFGGTTQQSVPDYAADPSGTIVPLTAHIRLANPRTASTASQRFLRRGFNYDLGIDANGNLDCGLIFNGFQQDIQRQFEATQTRLINEPLTDYIAPVGGGYFLVLPGVTDSNDYFARELLG